MEALILSCGTGGGHNAAGYAVKEELERRGHNVKMLFIATDYTCIPFTEETECDTYVIPSDKLTREFVKRGVPKERLLPLGIPVRREFAQPYDRLEVADRLGLDSKLHYILITGGSIGAGKLVRAVKVLARRYHRDRTVKLIVICGNNRRLYHKLYEQYGERHIILQRTEQMPDYVKLCDVMVIKPGGLSSTEAAVTGKRLVLMTPIPGCENHNLHFFTKNGMCRGVLTPDIQLVKEVDRLMKQSDDCEMIHRQHAVINARALEDICDYMEQ